MRTQVVAPRSLASRVAVRISRGSRHDACRDVAGWRLFTVLAVDDNEGVLRRVHTSDPAQYPVGGRKFFRGSEFGDTVLADGRAFLAHDPDELARVFPDHETITRLGCGSALNVPVRHRGRVLGSANLLDRADTYTPQHAAAIGPLAP